MPVGLNRWRSSQRAAAGQGSRYTTFTRSTRRRAAPPARSTAGARPEYGQAQTALRRPGRQPIARRRRGDPAGAGEHDEHEVRERGEGQVIAGRAMGVFEAGGQKARRHGPSRHPSDIRRPAPPC